jgi:hypothetical protein
MPKQKSIIKLEGSIDDMTFFKSKDGYMARKKNEVSKERFATDPAFARARENNTEFSTAAKAAQLLRAAIKPMLNDAKDGRVVSRLFAEMMRVVKSDPVNERGKRNVLNGIQSLLTGFEFNGNINLGNALLTVFTQNYDRASGKWNFKIEPFTPGKELAASPGATHFKIVAAGIELNFAEEKYVATTSYSDALLINNSPVTLPDLFNSVAPDSALPVFLVLGVVFMQHVNGIDYPLKDKSFNALKLVMVYPV